MTKKPKNIISIKVYHVVNGKAGLVCAPVELLDGVGGSLPDVGGEVSRGLLYGQHHDGHNDGHSDTGQHPQGTRPNQLVGVLIRNKQT